MKTSTYNAISPTTVSTVYTGRNVLTTSDSVRWYKNIVVTNGLVQGGKDRKTPNPIKYDIAVAGWGSRARYDYDVISDGTWARQVTNGPAMPPDYTALGIQTMSPDWTRVRNAAMAKIYDQLRGNNNLVVDLAEGGQTVHMIKSVLNLKKFILGFVRSAVRHKSFGSRIPKGTSKAGRRSLRRKWEKELLNGDPNLTAGQKALDYVTNKWLEGRYGWMPLVYSVYDAADNINRDLRNRVIYIKGRSGQTQNTPSKLISRSSTTEVSYSNVKVSYRVEYGMLFNVPGGPSLSDWTSLNPIGIAYELMTLSFVIDWVADVGGYLSLWENNGLFSKHFLMGYETTSYKESYTWKYAFQQTIPSTYWPNGSLMSGSQKMERQTAVQKRSGKNRVRLTSLPTPPGVTVKVRFGTSHQLDALALLHNFVGKPGR